RSPSRIPYRVSRIPYPVSRSSASRSALRDGRSSLPLLLLLSGRRLASGGAGRARGRTGLHGAGADGPQRPLRLHRLPQGRDRGGLAAGHGGGGDPGRRRAPDAARGDTRGLREPLPPPLPGAPEQRAALPAPSVRGPGTAYGRTDRAQRLPPGRDPAAAGAAP